jgi:DNA-binding beta-propeller fold protein YncE
MFLNWKTFQATRLFLLAFGMAITPAAAQIYVTSYGTNSVLEYNAVTGAFIGTFVPSGSGGLAGPVGIVFGPDGNLYVASNGAGAVLRYNGQTGAFMGTFVPAGSGGLTAPTGIAFGPNGNLFVNDDGVNIKEYDGATGTFITVFVVPTTGNFGGSILFGPDGNLYLTDEVDLTQADVEEFDGTTGAFIKAFPFPPPDNYDNAFGSVAFGPDGNLYVGTVGPCCPIVSGEILKYSTATGTLIGVFVPPGSGGLGQVNYMEFRPDGYLYVVSENTAGTDSPPYPARQILRYNATTGAFVEVFIPAGSGGLNQPQGITFAPTVPMSKFSIQALIAADPAFDEQGGFELGAGSKGINPVTDPVTFTFGTASIVIPPGSFQRLGSSNIFLFAGTIAGVSMLVDIQAQNPGARQFGFSIAGVGLDLASQAEPMKVGLQIGNNTGSETFKAIVFP